MSAPVDISKMTIAEWEQSKRADWDKRDKVRNLELALSEACDSVACDRCPLARECFDGDDNICDQLPEYFKRKAAEL